MIQVYAELFYEVLHSGTFTNPEGKKILFTGKQVEEEFMKILGVRQINNICQQPIETQLESGAQIMPEKAGKMASLSATRGAGCA
jgi:hypothetical protein